MRTFTRSDFNAYTSDLERLWQEGTPAGMTERSTSVATRKPGEAKSRRREKEVTMCPSPLDALSYGLSLKVKTKKRPIYTQKRSANTQKRPLHTPKRSVFTQKRPIYTQKRQ